MRVGGFVSVVVMLSACAGGEDVDQVQYPVAQQQFFAINKSCDDAFRKAENDIQRSLAFNECNSQRSQFAAQNLINGWVGRIKDISTDQGADVVTVDIEAEVGGFEMTFGTVNNRFSDMNTNSMILPNSHLFNVLANMKEGDLVMFSAGFLQHPEGKRGLWEISMTEQGSVSDPSFAVKFVDIRPYAPSSVSSAPQAPTSDAAIESADTSGAVAGDEYCGSQYRNLTPADMNDEAIARYEAECPGYDFPVQWQRAADAALREASRDFEMSEEEIKPSFDCAKASTPAERLICSDSGLARLDSQLAEVYSTVRAGSADKNALRDEQNAWRRGVRDACSDVSCMSAAYEGRIAQLSAR